MRARVWLNLIRVAVIALGVPTLAYWAACEQAMDWSSELIGLLIAGVAIVHAAMAVHALRFRLVMRIVGISMRPLETLRMNTLAMFYQFFVPLSIGADMTRFIKLKARAHGTLPSAAGIVLDHFVGLAALLVLVAALFAWKRPIALDPSLGAAGFVLIALLALAGLLILRRQRQRATTAAALVRHLAHRRREFFGAFLCSLLLQSMLAAAVWIGSQGWQLTLGYGEILFVLATAQIFQAVPLQLAGIGVADFAGTGLYLALGQPLASAVLLVSLFYLYRLSVAITGGLWDLLPTGSPPSSA